MQKKLLVVTVIIISAALLIGACSSQPTQPATQSPGEAAPQTTQPPQSAEFAYPSPVAQQQLVDPNATGAYPAPLAGEGMPVGSAVESLLATLQGAGLEVSAGGDVSQSYFSVAGKVLYINGEELQVYEYPTPESAEAEAGSVSADGSTVGTAMVDWISTPHFFRSGNLIVVYVGENQSVIQALQSLLGTQFAGG